MPHPRLDELGSLQRAVMEIVWERGEASVHAVRDALSASGRRPAYTTVLSVLQKLEKSGWVDHRRDGRTYLYRARRTRRQAGENSLRSFMNRVFEGDPLKLFQHLIDAQPLDDADLAELRRMIDARGKERGDARDTAG